jgi:hypothetical protein
MAVRGKVGGDNFFLIFLFFLSSFFLSSLTSHPLPPPFESTFFSCWGESAS